MASLDLTLQFLLVGLLVVTLVYAVRLERALQVLRNDKAALGEAIAGFDSSTRQAEAGIGLLQAASAEQAQLLAQRIERCLSLKDDMQFLLDRGDGLADRLDALVRAGRSLPTAGGHAAVPAAVPSPAVESAPKVRSQAERDLLHALRGAQ